MQMSALRDDAFLRQHVIVISVLMHESQCTNLTLGPYFVPTARLFPRFSI